MNELWQRWRLLAPREQWLVYATGLVVVLMAYVLLWADPQGLRLQHSRQAQQADVQRIEQAEAELAALQARAAADPNLAYRQALQQSEAQAGELQARIASDTAGLASPAQMQQVLRELLQARPQLRVLALQSFSEPLDLPQDNTLPADDAAQSPAALPLQLYRHGVRLTLEGGYFELLGYLQAVRGSQVRLYWQSLDYQVQETGSARIVLLLYTLSREQGWLGV